MSASMAQDRSQADASLVTRRPGSFFLSLKDLLYLLAHFPAFFQSEIGGGGRVAKLYYKYKYPINAPI